MADCPVEAYFHRTISISITVMDQSQGKDFLH